MPQYQSGVEIEGAYSFEITPRGSNAPVKIVFQKHSYKAGKRDSKEFSVGANKLKQPMQRGAGSHELEGMILSANAAAYRDLFDTVNIIDDAVMPDWNAARGPHFVEDYSIEDGIEDMSSLKITISESNGAIAVSSND